VPPPGPEPHDPPRPPAVGLPTDDPLPAEVGELLARFAVEVPAGVRYLECPDRAPSEETDPPEPVWPVPVRAVAWAAGGWVAWRLLVVAGRRAQPDATPVWPDGRPARAFPDVGDRGGRLQVETTE
jgi:hypothetical protein